MTALLAWGCCGISRGGGGGSGGGDGGGGGWLALAALLGAMPLAAALLLTLQQDQLIKGEAQSGGTGQAAVQAAAIQPRHLPGRQGEGERRRQVSHDT